MYGAYYPNHFFLLALMQLSVHGYILGALMSVSFHQLMNSLVT
jgi:hypothetical protein